MPCISFNKEAPATRMDRQTRKILIITIGTVSLTILAVYFFGILLPVIKKAF